MTAREERKKTVAAQYCVGSTTILAANQLD